MSDVTPLTSPTPLQTPLKHPHMTNTSFNYEDSYLLGVIHHIVVKADLGRSPRRWTPHTKLSVVDNQLAHNLLKIYVFNKSPFETAQVYSSSVPVRLSIGTSMCVIRGHVKVLMFIGQGYSSSLCVSFTPHLKVSLRTDQVLADLCVQ